jgi:hypothetical protein
MKSKMPSTRAMIQLAAMAAGLLLLPTTEGVIRFAYAQTPIVFAVPEGATVTVPTAEDPGDNVVFTGRIASRTNGGTCAAGDDFPVQNAVFVDPRNPGQRSSRVESVVILSSTSGVAPGTRLGSVTSAGPDCVINGITYNRYTGTPDD